MKIFSSGVLRGGTPRPLCVRPCNTVHILNVIFLFRQFIVIDAAARERTGMELATGERKPI